MWEREKALEPGPVSTSLQRLSQEARRGQGEELALWPEAGGDRDLELLCARQRELMEESNTAGPAQPSEIQL